MEKQLNTNYQSTKLSLLILFLFASSGFTPDIHSEGYKDLENSPVVDSSLVDNYKIVENYKKIPAIFKATFIQRGQHSGRYIKIDEAGVELAHDADQWKCVKDSETNLIWEVKTNYYRRYWNSKYTNTSNLLDGDTPTTVRGICLWSNEQGMLIEDESCHTQGYVDYINDLALCGYHDWRMPSELELRRVLPIKENNSYDSDYFPYNYPQQGMLNFWTYDNFPNIPGSAVSIRIGNSTSISHLLSYPRPSPVLLPETSVHEQRPRDHGLAVRLVRGN